MKAKKPELVLLVFILALFAGMAIVSLAWRNNGLYTGAYKGKIERSQQYSRQSAYDEDASVEPRAMGLREREIEKQEGNRYKTF